MLLSIVPLVILAFVLEVNTKNPCENSNHCKSYSNEDYEFQCPKENWNVLIHAIPDKRLSLECKNFDKFDLDVLPNCKAGNNISVEMVRCPLPEDNLLSMLQKFDTKNLKHLTLKTVATSTKESISKKYFNGLNDLTDLTLTYIYNKIDDDILDYCPNLKKFELDNSLVSDMSKFKFPPTLEVMRLTANLISEIPVGVFRNLTKLFQLHLRLNKIKLIRKGAFDGLKNLRSLELGYNHIEDIEENSFADLVELGTINLGSNKLTEIRADIFKYNRNLTSVRLEDNPKLILPDYLFANFEHLVLLKLKNSGIESLPEHIFQNSNIKELMLQFNRITQLPENIFQSVGKLEKLDLSHNKLSSLPKDIFSSLTSLKEINLSYNNLSEINDEIFKKTTRLETLYLNNNFISTIESNSFFQLEELKLIDLSNNLYKTRPEEVNPFNRNHKLEYLLLRNNRIEEFGDYNLYIYLKEIDLSFNRIDSILVSSLQTTSSHLSKVNLTHNQIKTIDFYSAEELAITNRDNKMKMVKVDLHNNPITCYCANYNLVMYFHNDMFLNLKKRVELQLDGTRCSQPEIYKNTLISEIKPEQVMCKINLTGCPKECVSFWRPFKNFTVLDCSYRNLTSFPKIRLAQYKDIEVNLTGNDIRGGLNETLGYDNVKNLFLSNNKIQDLEWVPHGIEKLSLDSNELTHLNPKLLGIMNGITRLESLKLAHNPWSCGCSALTLQIFIRNNSKKFQIKSTDVICKEDNKPLVEKIELCKSSATLILLSVLPVLSFLILTVVALVLYIYFRQEVKVWLFSKNLCLWCVSEDELDEDKIYDVFLSYSKHDEDFVMQNLLPVLESGPKPFKTCIHIRDWEPGEEIMNHVMNSVMNSRRTLVVLSNMFLESVWGKLEFRTAHMRGIEEGRARVIVVKYGELDESKLDDALKAYLNTNTYVEWGQPWFWNKLKYALPHSRQRVFHKTNQKNANVMLTIDEKFKLTPPPLKTVESTPPVITATPTLLENNNSKFTDKPLVIST